MQSFPSQIKQIADEKYYLAARVAKLEEMSKQHTIVDGKEKDITPNLNPKSTKLVINSDLLMLFDSNGKCLKPELVNKIIKCQLVYIPTLESIEHKVHNASIEKVPSQIQINVGINNMDKQSTKVSSLYEKVINFLQIKFPQADIFISSIFYRKDASFTKETEDTQGVSLINHRNIAKDMIMSDNKHLNK